MFSLHLVSFVHSLLRCQRGIPKNAFATSTVQEMTVLSVFLVDLLLIIFHFIIEIMYNSVFSVLLQTSLQECARPSADADALMLCFLRKEIPFRFRRDHPSSSPHRAQTHVTFIRPNNKKKSGVETHLESFEECKRFKVNNFDILRRTAPERLPLPAAVCRGDSSWWFEA